MDCPSRKHKCHVLSVVFDCVFVSVSIVIFDLEGARVGIIVDHCAVVVDVVVKHGCYSIVDLDLLTVFVYKRWCGIWLHPRRW